ncbi:hypothetical protein PCASD_06163 [Puccinia coronata f. sp. avenae]|uniref:Uncharacterized protein n=1 Tax=Puccinia coronata f. sp. avenae TaxID=200324 RepID=A0A2N5TGH9_9BASI|nr:hypothetical protein PCASD_06163 [Puccinia coronata f. sp. avenae]
MEFKSANSSPEAPVTELRTKRPKPILTLSYHLPTGVVQGRLTTKTGDAAFTRSARSPALIPIRSPLEPSAPRSPFGHSSALIKAPHLSQSKDAFSPPPPPLLPPILTTPPAASSRLSRTSSSRLSPLPLNLSRQKKS